MPTRCPVTLKLAEDVVLACSFREGHLHEEGVAHTYRVRHYDKRFGVLFGPPAAGTCGKVQLDVRCCELPAGHEKMCMDVRGHRFYHAHENPIPAISRMPLFEEPS